MIKSNYQRKLFFMVKIKERLTEDKKNIIASLIEEYDIKTAEDIQYALKDLLCGTIESMLIASFAGSA